MPFGAHAFFLATTTSVPFFYSLIHRQLPSSAPRPASMHDVHLRMLYAFEFPFCSPFYSTFLLSRVFCSMAGLIVIGWHSITCSEPIEYDVAADESFFRDSSLDCSFGHAQYGIIIWNTRLESSLFSFFSPSADCPLLIIVFTLPRGSSVQLAMTLRLLPISSSVILPFPSRKAVLLLS